MTKLKLTLVEVRGEEIVTIKGANTDSARSDFRKEVHELYSRACKIISPLGMHSISCCVASDNKCGVALRSADSTQEKFDARGVFATGEQISATELLEATRSN